MKWQKVVSAVALAGTVWAGAMASVASSAVTTVVPDKAPDVFVGAGDPLGVYSLKTGELVRTLPAGGTPQVADYGRLVYYLRDAPGLPE